MARPEAFKGNSHNFLTEAGTKTRRLADQSPDSRWSSTLTRLEKRSLAVNNHYHDRMLRQLHRELVVHRQWSTGFDKDQSRSYL